MMTIPIEGATFFGFGLRLFLRGVVPRLRFFTTTTTGTLASHPTRFSSAASEGRRRCSVDSTDSQGHELCGNLVRSLEVKSPSPSARLMLPSRTENLPELESTIRR